MNKYINNRQIHILVVDDEAMVLNVIDMLLTDYEYQVTCAATGTNALAIYAESPEKFNLVLTDQSMPGLSGQQLADEIHKINETQITILMSGDTYDLKETPAIKGVLPKPFNSNSILDLVKKYTDN